MCTSWVVFGVFAVLALEVSGCNRGEPTDAAVSAALSAASVDLEIQKALEAATAAAAEARSAAAEAKAALEAAKAVASAEESPTPAVAAISGQTANLVAGSTKPKPEAEKPQADEEAAVKPKEKEKPKEETKPKEEAKPKEKEKPKEETKPKEPKPEAASTSTSTSGSTKPPKKKPGLFADDILPGKQKASSESERKRKTQAPTRPGAN